MGYETVYDELFTNLKEECKHLKSDIIKKDSIGFSKTYNDVVFELTKIGQIFLHELNEMLKEE